MSWGAERETFSRCFTEGRATLNARQSDDREFESK